MNYERSGYTFPRHSSRDNGKQVPYHNGILRLKPLGAALQQNSQERDRRENVAGLICYCHSNLTPLYHFLLPETERKQVYWQAGLGAADNNVGFVPR